MQNMLLSPRQCMIPCQTVTIGTFKSIAYEGSIPRICFFTTQWHLYEHDKPIIRIMPSRDLSHISLHLQQRLVSLDQAHYNHASTIYNCHSHEHTNLTQPTWHPNLHPYNHLKLTRPIPMGYSQNPLIHIHPITNLQNLSLVQRINGQCSHFSLKRRF